MQFEFDEQKCREAKAKLKKSGDIMGIWRKSFAPSNRIGNCTTLYRKLKPVDYNDFFIKYIDHAEHHKNWKTRWKGLTYDEILDLSERYKNKVYEETGVEYDVSTFFYDALCHIIIETFDGQKHEEEFRNYLINLGYSVSTFDGDIDTIYGMDVKVTRNDGKVSAIQIKPLSFYQSNRWDVQRDRIGLCEKYENALNNLGIKTYYAIYSHDKDSGKTSWVLNSDGKLRFKINDIFGYDPSDIAGTFVRKQIPNTFKEL